MPGSSPIVTRWPGGRGEQQVVQVAAEDADGLGLGLLAQSLLHLDRRGADSSLHAPRPAHGLGQPRVGGASLLRDAEAGRRSGARAPTARPRRRRPAASPSAAARLRCGRAAAPARGATAASSPPRSPRSSRRTSRPRPPCRRRRPTATRRGPTRYSRRPPTSVGVLGEGLHQDPARAFERGVGVGDALVGVDERWPRPPAGTSVGSCSSAIASGSRPASRAICAFVRRFGL